MAGAYTVTDVAERRRYTAGGREVTYYDVTIETVKGATGSVRIATADYTPENVKVALDELADRLDLPFGL